MEEHHHHEGHSHSHSHSHLVEKVDSKEDLAFSFGSPDLVAKRMLSESNDDKPADPVPKSPEPVREKHIHEIPQELRANGSSSEHDNHSHTTESNPLQQEIKELRKKIDEMKLQHRREIDELKETVAVLNKSHTKKITKRKLLKGDYKKTLYEGHQGGIYCLSMGGNILVTGSGDKTIRVWDTDNKKGKPLQVLTGHTSGVCCVQYIKETDTVVSGSWDKTIRVWNRKTGDSRILKAHVNGVRCLQVIGNRLISGASDKIIFVWNLAQGQCELILKGHDSGIYCLEFRGNKLVTGSGDNTIRVWDLANGKCTKVLKGHTADVYCLKWNRNTLVSGGGDKTVRVWDLESGECLRSLTHPDAVYAVAMNESLIMSGCGDVRLRIWDLTSGECLRVIQLHTDGIYSLELHGDKVVTGSIDKNASLLSFHDHHEY